ncbi:tyrosine-protein phosphatase [Nocardia sp. alder85J]|uniref:tyrosine-protein phosphatase n=1 Tax=Nocardia sp. alder85J TaxID=2862949 RepID=UPI001CD2EC7B|nr:tyrosine-protein phosphatase [Nocardia sp. alder85J]MCX4094082.1 tyrosine-protein phosphatase [Nocardia sp. alder85J]
MVTQLPEQLGDPARGGRIPVDGTYNFRDVAGIPAGDGRIRPGVLYRSDALHELTDAGRDLLRQLRIGTVIDLRTVSERDREPSLLDGLDAVRHHAPIFESTADAVPTGPDLSLTEVYDFIVDERGPQLAHAIGLIAAAGGPAVVHCTAGKDRTGLVIALTLAAVGVTDADIVADYAVTERHLGGEWADRALAGLAADYGMPPTDATRGFLAGSPAALLTHSLERIRDRSGSVRGYLTAHGLGEHEFAALTDHLVTTDPTEGTLR